MLRETYFLLLLFVCHIWRVTFYQMFIMHIRFARNTLDMDTFATLSNFLLKRMQKQGRKHSFTISILHKIFGK